MLECLGKNSHLKEVGESEVFKLGRFGEGRPHVSEVLLPGLLQSAQGSLCAVSEHKQKHCPPFFGSRLE
jgi:hypothetical protein